MCTNQNKIKKLSKIVPNRSRLAFIAFFLMGLAYGSQTFAMDLEGGSLLTPLIDKDGKTRNPMHSSYDTLTPVDFRLSSPHHLSRSPKPRRVVQQSPLVEMGRAYRSPGDDDVENPLRDPAAMALFSPDLQEDENAGGPTDSTVVTEEEVRLAQVAVDQIKHFVLYQESDEMKAAVAELDEYRDISPSTLPRHLAENAKRAVESVPPFFGTLLIVKDELTAECRNLRKGCIHWRKQYQGLDREHSALKSSDSELRRAHEMLVREREDLDLEKGALVKEWATSLQLADETDPEQLKAKTFELRNAATTAQTKITYLKVALGVGTVLSIAGWLILALLH
jgi:hypothetical protein